MIFKNLIKDAESDATLDRLEQDLCSTDDFTKQCSVKLRTWWPNVAKVVFDQSAFRMICMDKSDRQCTDPEQIEK